MQLTRKMPKFGESYSMGWYRTAIVDGEEFHLSVRRGRCRGKIFGRPYYYWSATVARLGHQLYCTSAFRGISAKQLVEEAQQNQKPTTNHSN